MEKFLEECLSPEERKKLYRKQKMLPLQSKLLHDQVNKEYLQSAKMLETGDKGITRTKTLNS